MMGKSNRYIYSDIKFTIWERHNKWWLDFYHNKKRVRKSTELFANTENLKKIKKELIPDIVVGLGKELDLKAQREKEKEEQKNNQTLAEYASEFFVRKRKRKENREHTLERNIMHFNNHILEFFGHKTLKEIIDDVESLDDWQTEKIGKYALSTVKKYRSVFFSILEDAKKRKRIKYNPLQDITLPKKQSNSSKKEQGNIFPFNETELNKIIENANGYMKNFILFMLSTGARPGEIVALKWSDIDFERKKIDIKRTRIRSKKKNEIEDGNVKTDDSDREIDMLALAEEALLRQKELTGKYEYIFLNQSKRPFYTHDVIGVNFDKILRKSGVEDRVLYNLRHTFASQMISKGADILWISKMLGHKDTSITLKIYARFIKEDDDIRFKKIEKMDTIMGTMNNLIKINSDK